MNRLAKFLAVMVLLLAPTLGWVQSTCSAPPLSDEQVRQIVANGRGTRTDLPSPFPNYRWVVRRDGCSYIYMEIALPETPENYYIFRLNQNGIIIDVQVGNKI